MTSMTTSTVSMMNRKRKQSASAHWEKEFYKNGYPVEVIVIEDSPTPPPLGRRHQQPQHQQHVTARLPLSGLGRPPSNGVYGTPTIGSPYTLLPDATYSQTCTNQTYISKLLRQQQQFNKRSRLDVPPHHVASITQPPTAKSSGPRTSIPQPLTTNCDDKDGHYIIKPNESLTARYKIMRLLGQGTFGKVVMCYDRIRRIFCAVKVIRAIPKYREASMIEIRVLNTLKEHDPLNLNKCIHLTEWFDYRNHICMVFELLGQSVFDFLKSNHFKPFPPKHIRQFAKQLLTSVAFIHDLKLIHTDLKPENILLVNHGCDTGPDGNKQIRILQDTEIRLIDFGSATFEQDYHSTVVSTRHYRAPEIILGMDWSYPCDVWSIGCILVEFFTGDALFHTHDNLEHLAMMEAVIGAIPPHLTRLASRDGQKFFKDTKLKYPDTKTSRQSRQFVRNMKPLYQLIPPTNPLNTEFRNLIQQMLWYDPSARISAREALRHPFFTV